MPRLYQCAVVSMCVAACGDGAPAIDAAAVEADAGGDATVDARLCEDDLDCGDDLQYACRGGSCFEVCEGVEGGRACNVGIGNDFASECCAPDETCCPVAYERDRCVAGPCPLMCWTGQPFAGLECPHDGYCDMQPPPQPSLPPGLPDAGPLPVGECVAGASGCLTACPAERRCGPREEDCCADGTACEDGCCVILPRDAGP